MQNYQTWLETPNVARTALVQAQALVNGTLTTRYLSTQATNVDGVDYLPIIKGTISIDESISTNYAASISYGDIELANNNGEYDSWLDDIWSNKSVKIYVGSPASPASKDWSTLATVAGTPVLTCIAYNGTVYVAGGTGGKVYTSSDGINWVSRTSGTTNTFYNIIWDGTYFVAAVGPATGSSNSTPIRYSTDGVTWTGALAAVGAVTAVARSTTYNTSVLVSSPVTSAGYLKYSTSITTWASITTKTNASYTSVASSGPTFVAVGYDITTNLALISSNITANISSATSWVNRTMPTGVGKLNSVIWSGTQYVVVGVSGAILTSSDAVTWTQRTSGVAYDLTSVVYTGKYYLAFGSGENASKVLISKDGITWVASATVNNKNITSGLYSSNKIIATTNTGSVLLLPTTYLDPDLDTYYELIFSGLIDDLDSKSRTSLNLKIRDKLEKVNTSVSEALLGNYFQGNILADNSTVFQNQYKNNLKPICFGEVHNISPMLIDSSEANYYMVNTEAVEQVIEVRDNGTPVAFTTTPSTIQFPAGSFKLAQTPIGTVTCSVQGTKKTVNIPAGTTSATYTNTAANTIATILKHYGQQIDYSELDAASFTALGTQEVGVYLTDRVNVLAICQDIAKSCGLILTTTRSGVLKLVELSIPTSATIAITEADMLLNSLVISQRPEVIAGVKLGYAKNWTVQTLLTTNIPQQHKDLYATEWLESIARDDTVKTNYSVTTEPALEPSYLIDKAKADAVAQSKLNLFKTRRKIVTMTCTAKFLSVQVGDAVTVTASRFSLNNGPLGRVVSTKPNWLRGTIEIGVLI